MSSASFIQSKVVPFPPVLNKLVTLGQWKPTSIPGCVFWLDANDQATMVLSGSNLNTWVSKGTASCSTTNTSNTAFYTKYLGYPAIFFNSNALLTTNAINVVSASGTTWITCSTNLAPISASLPDAALVLGTSGANGAERAIRYDPPLAATMYSINTGTGRGANGFNANGTRGFVDTASYFAAYQNGTQVTSNTTAVTFQAGTTQNLLLGQWNLGYLYGYINECIIYNTALTLSQYQQVESYLSYKWGFQSSLPNGFTLPQKSNTGIYIFPPVFQYPSVPTPKVITMSRFLPTTITNLVGWYDAADSTQVVVSGSAVTQWKDKSGQGNNTTSASGSPQYNQALLNKKPGITFNGSSSYFAIPKIISDDWSLFIVLTTTQTGPGAGGQWWAGAGIFDAEVGGTIADFGTSLYGSTFATGVGNPPSSDNTIFSGVSINTGAGFICEFTRVSSSGYFENFVNGSSQGSTTGGTGARSAPTRIIIGALQTLATFFSGTIFEIVVYSSYISQGQRQSVEGYLAWKWGLTGQLPGNHPYKLFPPPPS
jgi:hypothetical protein